MNRPLGKLAGLALAFAPATAWAHADHSHLSGFTSGFWHPLTGADHLLAMVLVGVIAGSRAALWLPLGFLGGMIAGFCIGALTGGGIAEPLIVSSLIVLGAGVAFRVRPPLPIAAVAIAVFGFAHGLAHGAETPSGAFPALFAAGFFVSTGALHACGLWLVRVLPAPALQALGALGGGLGLVLAGTA
jgi:urease accessory protein